MNKILIADDNCLVLDGIRSNMDWAALDAEVVCTCSNGAGVLEYLKDSPVDLIISDISMPGMSGLEMADRLLAEHSDFMIIFISAYDNFEYAKEAVRIGAFDYVEKPIDYAYLKKVAADALRQLETERRNREILERSRPVLTADFFSDLLRTSPEESRYYLADSAEYLEIPLDYAQYLCLHIEVVNDMEFRKANGIEQFHMQMLRLKDDLRQHMGEFPFCYCLEHRNSMTVITASDQPPAGMLQSLYRMLDSFLSGQENSPLTVQIGIGCTVDTLWGLQQSYTDAEQALKYRYFQPQNNLFDIRDFSAKKPHSFLLNDGKEKTLIRLLTQKDIPAITAYMEALGDKICRDFPDQNTVILLAYDLVNKILRFIHDLGLESDYLMKDIQLFSQNIPGFSDSQQLCSGLLDVCKQVCFALDSTTKSYHQNLNRTVHDYIRSHYHDPELGLSSIAAAVNVSPAHLSALFRKLNHMTITDRITEIRMEHAELLLKTTSLPIKEISSKSGYANQYYFSACFKKKNGCTPSVFRGG